jgi:hypothetical protein
MIVLKTVERIPDRISRVPGRELYGTTKKEREDVHHRPRPASWAERLGWY